MVPPVRRGPSWATFSTVAVEGAHCTSHTPGPESDCFGWHKVGVNKGTSLGKEAHPFFRNDLQKAHRPSAGGFRVLALPHLWDSFCPSTHSLSNSNSQPAGGGPGSPDTTRSLSAWLHEALCKPLLSICELTLGSFYPCGWDSRETVDHPPTRQAHPWLGGMEGAFPGVPCRATVQRQSECCWAAGNCGFLGNSQCVWLGRQEAGCQGLGWEAFT